MKIEKKKLELFEKKKIKGKTNSKKLEGIKGGGGGTTTGVRIPPGGDD